MAPVTNTIVFTSLDDSVSDSRDALEHWLSANVLNKITVTAENPVQLIFQKNSQRALVVCPTQKIAQLVYQALLEVPLGKSLAYDYAEADFDDSKDRLQVPKAERVFLTSPPASPPPGFDYARCEQPPPTNPHAQLLQNDGREFLTLLDSKIASIALHRCPDALGSVSQEAPARTACPPRPGDPE